MDLGVTRLEFGVNSIGGASNFVCVHATVSDVVSNCIHTRLIAHLDLHTNELTGWCAENPFETRLVAIGK